MKNLALSGFTYVELIDLDTIDVSNLNRQFLFRPEHVGHPKSLVAAEAAQRFNPDLKVIAYHDNIKSHRFNIAYFQTFDLVLNALDNVDARRHVNRLCLAAKVPLFDSGTTGYLGQVMPILKGYTACYECLPKPTQKVYPICTIRSTPDKPVHCIVWAKECLKLLFGPSNDSMLFEDEASGESSTYMHLISFPKTQRNACNSAKEKLEVVLNFTKTLLIALFHTEIQKRIDMNVYKTAKITPVPLALDLIDAAIDAARLVYDPEGKEKEKVSDNWSFQMWSLSQNMLEFIKAYLDVLQEEDQHPHTTLMGTMAFDKDDEWSMRFVAAASNLRAHVFSIPTLSFHDAKGIAGNIIPAIASTNAIIAGTQVLQAMKFLTTFTKQELFIDNEKQHSEEDLKTIKQKMLKLFPHVYCSRLPNRKGVFLQPSESDAPVTSCFVCGKSELTLQIDVEKTTLDTLVTKVIKSKLGFNEPMISMGSNILYEEGEDCDEDLKDNLPLLLAKCPGGGIQDGAVLSISDFTQDLEMTMVVRHVNQEEFEKQEATAVDLFILEGQDAFAQRMKQQADAVANASLNGDKGETTEAPVDTEDVVFMIDSDEIQAVSSSAPVAAASSSSSSSSNDKKRKLEEDVVLESDSLHVDKKSK